MRILAPKIGPEREGKERRKRRRRPLAIFGFKKPKKRETKEKKTKPGTFWASPDSFEDDYDDVSMAGSDRGPQIPKTWFILSYTGLYWVILVHTGLYWSKLIYTGLCRFIPGYTGLYQVILVYTGLYWFILVYTSLYWSILVYTGLYWSIPVYTGLYCSLLVHAGPYWFILGSLPVQQDQILLQFGIHQHQEELQELSGKSQKNPQKFPKNPPPPKKKKNSQTFHQKFPKIKEKKSPKKSQKIPKNPKKSQKIPKTPKNSLGISPFPALLPWDFSGVFPGFSLRIFPIFPQRFPIFPIFFRIFPFSQFPSGFSYFPNFSPSFSKFSLRRPCGAPGSSRRCSAGWLSFGPSCFSFSRRSLSWLAARNACADLGAHLAVVGSEQEQEFLLDNIERSVSYWLGMTDAEQEGKWRWVTGEVLDIGCFWCYHCCVFGSITVVCPSPRCSCWDDGVALCVLVFFLSPYPRFWDVWLHDPHKEQKDCGALGPKGLWVSEHCWRALRWVCERPAEC
ncbi:uncharacterized protein LOC134055419 [Cinclus cinclus]|uniref:uncharacterized protein LOC134055419 n=1 Tax=Cinclus cinclus TaxID=127875 RepID=UPI002E0D7E29